MIRISPASYIGLLIFTLFFTSNGFTKVYADDFEPLQETSDPDTLPAINLLLTSSYPPFGTLDTPVHGSTVSGTIPVSGWALDKKGMESVKLYVDETYIADAYFVEGARPDVSAAYPDYPDNTRAGFQYNLLTHFLTNRGNGTYNIKAVARNTSGLETVLGTKTFICDNASSAKPFGTIDTPTPGGTASGTSYINWGWALTPKPNTIPKDGSTISVYIDGVFKGHPTYDIYRSDIYAYFPDYNNSDGAAGYFTFDTTIYDNGVHTIQWVVVDDDGNTDSIGARYFTIQNP